MMTEQLRVSVVAAPLAAIDPRALSQAWYSALHVARTVPSRPAATRARVPASASPKIASAVRPAGDAKHRSSVALPVRSGGIAQSAGAAEIRSDRAPLRMARRIERALVRPQRPPSRAAFVVGEGSARALVVLQTRGGTTHLIAMCAPAQRETIARALAQVRASLAARGLALKSRVQASPACS